MFTTYQFYWMLRDNFTEFTDRASSTHFLQIRHNRLNCWAILTCGILLHEEARPATLHMSFPIPVVWVAVKRWTKRMGIILKVIPSQYSVTCFMFGTYTIQYSVSYDRASMDYWLNGSIHSRYEFIVFLLTFCLLCIAWRQLRLERYIDINVLEWYFVETLSL